MTDLLVNPGQWKDQVISENPYVKILGDVTWSDDYEAFTALAQVESMLAIVSLKVTPNGTLDYTKLPV